MKMKGILLVLAVLINFSAVAQKTYKVIKDTTEVGKIYDGLVTFDDLKAESSFGWMTAGMKAYTPEDKPMGLLKFYLRQYSLVVFLGTWCDDSHNIIPKLAKVLEDLNYPATKVTMYGVDRDKTTKGNEQKKFRIHHVPTIILFKDDIEVGRITENVKISVEGDLSTMLQEEMNGHEPK